MKNRYTENLDGITASGEAKQRTVDKLIEYSAGAYGADAGPVAPAATEAKGKALFFLRPRRNRKNKANQPRLNRRGEATFFKSKRRAAVALSTAAVMLFCAVFVPVVIRRRVLPGMLAGCIFNTSGTTGLGIIKSGTRPRIAAKGTLSLSPKAAYAQEGKDWMIVYGEDGSIEDVIFFRYKKDGGSEEVTQLKMSAPIKKLYVTDKFTFMMFSLLIDSDDNYKRQPHYQQRGYTCDTSHSQSFAIDNATGKIYSLEALFNKYNQTVFMEVFEECVQIEYAHGAVVERHFYFLDIVDGELVYTRLLGNKRHEYYDENYIYFVTDKFGQYFAAADYDGVSDKVMHFNYQFNEATDLNFSSIAGTMYGKGSDGYVYKVTVTGAEKASDREYVIKRMGENFEETEITPELDVSIRFQSQQNEVDNGPNQTVIVKGTKLFHTKAADSLKISVADLSEGIYRESGELDLSGGRDKPDNKRLLISEAEVYYIMRLDHSSDFVGRDKLYRYDMVTGVESVVLEGVYSAVVSRSGLLVYNGPIPGRDHVPAGSYATKAYKVNFTGGQAVAEILFDIPADLDVITLQPLN